MSGNTTSRARHELGELAPLAALSYEWRTRAVRLGGTTWAGLWYLSHRAEVHELIARCTFRVDAALARQLIRAGRLPGVRDVTNLTALLLEEDQSCDTSTTKGSGDIDIEDLPAGIPIFDHGIFDQASLSQVRHATHLTRYLDDYHEPTVAALRRRLLRKAVDPDDVEQRQTASVQAVEIFLNRPTYWRDVVAAAILIRTIREIEDVLQGRLSGPRRTNDELTAMVIRGLETLRVAEMYTIAGQISQTLEVRRRRLEAANVVLMYEEHQYLQLTGIVKGQSVHRHLPRGFHLIFSDQLHRRNDRTAGLWLDTSDDEHQAGPYYYAQKIPPAYATRQRRAAFRLRNEHDLRRYMVREVEEDR